MRHFLFNPPAAIAAVLVLTLTAAAQQAPPIIFIPPEQRPQPAQPQTQPPPQVQPVQPGATQPAQPNAASPAPATPQLGSVAAARLSDSGGFMLNNVSLVELVDILAKRLKINYILDPRVKGSVTIYTYGEIKAVDLMPLLQTILRVNGATIVQVGDLYRIVPLNNVAPLPMDPIVNADPKTLPNDERMILNLVFLKYTTVGEISALVKPFLGEGATMATYDPANLLLILDNSRNMRRTMELLSLFDSDTFASQRVRLFDVSEGRPSDLVKELESVFRAYALSEKNSTIKFLPVDRINTIIAVSPNPGIFAEVEKWLKKLDVPVKITAGAVGNYVYRLKYGRAETVAMAIMVLYGGGGGYGMMGGGMMGGMGAYGGGMGAFGGGMGAFGGGMGAYGGGMGAFGGGMGAYGGGMGAYGGGMGAYGGGMGAYGGAAGMPGGGMGAAMNTPGAIGNSPYPQQNAPMFSGTAAANTAASIAAGVGTDLTGSYMGAGGYNPYIRVPHVVPNPFDNTLLVQGTPQEWEQISRLLEQLDVPPRQVLIDAKIYEVDLTGELSAGVTSYLQKRDSGDTKTTAGGPSKVLGAIATGSGLTLTAGALVLRSHELLTLLTATDSTTKTKVIAAPSLIATDSVPATLNVGQEVPVLTSQAIAGGVQSGGTSLFTNTISNRSTGVTLNLLARVNSSGVVTMIINQDVSTPQAPQSGGIQSPSFQRRSVQTQVTVQDGDTIAIAGIITESDLRSSGGVPGLNRIPVFGALFGAKSYSKARTELVILLTPRVIYDTNQIAEASDEIKARMKKLRKSMRDE